MTQRVRDRKSSALLMAISLLLFILIPWEIEVVPATVGMDARFFPYLTVFGIFCAALFLFIGTYGRDDSSKDSQIAKIERGTKIRVFGLIAIMFCYISLLYYLGYNISTALALAAMMRHYGLRKWQVVVPFSLAVTAVIYLIFSRLMDVILPEGVLFF